MEVFIPDSDRNRFIFQRDNVRSRPEDEPGCRKDWAACRI